MRFKVQDKDFCAKFEWCWTNRPPILKNRVSVFENSIQDEEKMAFKKEVDRWIEEGIFVPWKKKVQSGILPLMALIQLTKHKIRRAGLLGTKYISNMPHKRQRYQRMW